MRQALGILSGITLLEKLALPLKCVLLLCNNSSSQLLIVSGLNSFSDGDLEAL